MNDKVKPMTALTAYCFKEKPIRTVMISDELHFIAKDVCDVLELTNSRKTLSSLDADEKGVTTGYTGDGASRQMATVNEAGLYRLILRSRKPQAKAFSRWVTHDVLPAIRRTGGYQPTESITYLVDEVNAISDMLVKVTTAIEDQKATERKMKTLYNIMADIAKNHLEQSKIITRLLATH